VAGAADSSEIGPLERVADLLAQIPDADLDEVRGAGGLPASLRSWG
jgi:hypothetical protein